MILRASPLDPQLSAEFAAIQVGIPSTLTNAELATKISKFSEATGDLNRVITLNRQKSTPNCARFNAVADAMTKDIIKTLKTFEGVVTDVNDAVAISSHARLQFELPKFLTLAKLLADDREGGYGFLDRRQKYTCPFADRDLVKSEFAIYGQYVGQFLHDAFGSPGVEDLEAMTERLLALALRGEVHSQRVSTALMVGFFVTSPITWRYGQPILKTAFEGALGDLGRRLAANFWFGKASFIGAMMVEGEVYRRVGLVINPTAVQLREFDPDRPQMQLRFPSWEGHIGDMEKLVNSPLVEPQLYLGFMSTLSAQYGRKVQEWGEKNKDVVQKAMESDQDFARKATEISLLNREAVVMDDLIPMLAARQLPAVLARDWNIRVSCGEGQWTGGPSAVQCLIGTRRLARALYRGLLKVPKTEVNQIVSFNIGTFSESQLQGLETTVRINLRYKSSPEQMAAFATAAYDSREVVARRKLLTQVAITTENYTQGDAPVIEVEDELSLRDQWAGLSTLVALRQREPQLFKLSQPVVLTLTKTSRALHEKHLDLRLAIDATADYEQTRAFMMRYLTEDKIKVAAEQRDRLRAQIKETSASIKSMWSVDSRCSEGGDLTLFNCLRTLQRIELVAKHLPRVRVEAQEIVVTGRNEPGANFEVVRSLDERPHRMWTIQQNFSGSLFDFLKRSGWALD